MTVILFPATGYRSLIDECATILQRYWSQEAWDRIRGSNRQIVYFDALEAGIELTAKQVETKIEELDRAIQAELERRGFVDPDGGDRPGP